MQLQANDSSLSNNSSSRVAFGQSYKGMHPYKEWSVLDSKLDFMINRDLTFKEREEFLRRKY